MRLGRLAIAVALTVAVTGCGPDEETKTADATPGASSTATADAAPADATAELAAAATKLTSESMRVKTSMAVGLNGTGQVDETGSRMEMTLSITAPGTSEKSTVVTRKVGDDIYLKFTGAMGSMLSAANRGKWLHVDATKVAAGSAFSPESNDPKSVSKLVGAAAKVKKTGERSYQGVLDMTKSASITEEAKKSLGIKATAVPFTADVDAEGRMVKLVIDVGSIAAGAGKMTTEYHDFGLDVQVKAPPAAQVVEMPKEMLGVVGA